MTCIRWYTTNPRWPGLIAQTRIQASGKMTPEQRADKREVLARHPNAACEDWSKGMWRNRARYCNFKRVRHDGTCALIWWM
jgi:hypothetical protein